MKKLSFVFIVLLLVLLVSCSEEAEIDILPVEEPEPVAEPEPVVEEVVEEEVLELEEIEFEGLSEDSSDLLIKERIKGYSYATTIDVSKDVGSFTLNGYQATYRKDLSTAKVSVLFPEMSLEKFESDFRKGSNFILLEEDDYSFLSHDVYYDSDNNSYVWINSDKVYLLEDFVGYDVLNEYMGEYPVTNVADDFDGEEILTIDEGELWVIYANERNYVIELIDIDSNDEEITFSVNNNRVTWESNDAGVVGGLKVSFNDVDFDNKNIRLKITGTAKFYESFQLNLGESVAFNDGEIKYLKLIDVDVAKKEVDISLGNDVDDFYEDEVRTLEGYQVKVDSILINSIGQVNAIVDLVIWK